MKLRVKLFDLVMAFSHALDQVHPTLAGHHRRVGFLVNGLAERLAMPLEERRRVFLAGVMHDVGVLPLNVGADDLIFERERHLHARAGWLLLGNCPPMRHIAGPVRHHHEYWEKAHTEGPEVREGSLINLADRVDILLRRNPDFRQASEETVRVIQGRRPGIFAPRHVATMVDMLRDERNHDALAEAHLHLPAGISADFDNLFLESEGIIQFSTLFGHVIDSCSPFTATHSTGVAWTACAMGRWLDMDRDALDILFVAGMLHDIGKLGVPSALLEKPGSLTPAEFIQVKQHAVLGRHWLDAVPGFEKVSLWGGLHHERLDGTGYPEGLKDADIPVPARIMAVADIFTALTEDRPYRKGMDIDNTMRILKEMAEKGYLDAGLVALMEKNEVEINDIRIDAQNKARRAFDELHAACAVAEGLREGD